MTHPENSWSEGSLDATEEEEMPKKTMNYCEGESTLYHFSSYSNMSYMRRCSSSVLACANSSESSRFQLKSIRWHKHLQQLAL